MLLKASIMFFGGESTITTNANEFAWSVSINKSFKSCERDYYYHNYGSWEGWSPEADLVTRELYILKFLKTREDWKDASVHDEIARVLKMLRAQNILFPKDKSVERLAAQQTRTSAPRAGLRGSAWPMRTG